MRINPNNPKLAGVLNELGKQETRIKRGEDPRKEDTGGIRGRLARYETMPEVKASVSKDRMDIRGKRKRKNQPSNADLVNKILKGGNKK